MKNTITLVEKPRCCGDNIPSRKTLLNTKPRCCSIYISSCKLGTTMWEIRKKHDFRKKKNTTSPGEQGFNKAKIPCKNIR